MGDGLAGKVVRGALWTYLERFSVQGVNFLVGMVLARLLTPTDYGSLAIVMSAVMILGAFADCGITRALIQKKEYTETDCNSVFYFNLGFTLVLYGVLFAAAPLVADFYGDPHLTDYLRVLGLMMICCSLDAVQNVHIQREFRFNLSFRVNLAASAVAGVTGITLAYRGWGTWALVYSTLASTATGTLMRLYLVRWLPRRLFSWASVRVLIGYGWKLMAGNMLSRSYDYLYDLLIGKAYSRADLGIVNKAMNLPRFAAGNLYGSILRVLFPALSQLQDDPERFRSALSKSLRTAATLVFPFMMLGMVTAPRVIRLLFGGQWVSGAIFMTMACFAQALLVPQSINLQAVNALGKSGETLKFEIASAVVKLAFFFACFRTSLTLLMTMMLVVAGTLLALYISWWSGRLHGHSLWAQLKDVAPSALVLVPIAAPVYFLGRLFTGETVPALIAALAVQTAVAMALYAPFAWYSLKRLKGKR